MKTKFRDSLASLQSVRTLTLAAVLIALAIVIEPLTIPFWNEFLKFTFTFLPFMAICMLFGPVVGAISGGLIDFIGAIVFYGSINPLLLIVELCSGFVCGMILYERKNTLWRCMLVRFVVCMVFNAVFTTMGLAIWNGMGISGFVSLFATRAIKNLFCFPVEGLLLFFVLKLVQKNSRCFRRKEFL